MLTINTNLSSLIAQSSLKTSTNKLNQAIERMTTGFKINHASDNAANYSIATNMTTKIGAYDVAEDNASMGLDMVTTADDTLSMFSDQLSRARALCEQARNGTYGSKSLDAIKSELTSIVENLKQVKNNIEYNGINLFGKDGMPVANPETGFIADVVVQNPDVTVTDPTKLAEAIANNDVIGIANAETLAELANLVNNDIEDCEGKTIVLTNDIDLSGYANWTPIGYHEDGNKDKHVFKGDFNGNGHVISNLTITSSTHNGVGLFGYISGSNLSNISIKNLSITSDKRYVAGIVGVAWYASYLTNCNSEGSIVSSDTGSNIGMVAGSCEIIKNSYSSGTINGGYTIGGVSSNGKLENCYSTVDVTGLRNVGGLQGFSDGTVNCYATGNVFGTDYLGGFVGTITADNEMQVLNCYSTGNINGGSYIGGFLGYLNAKSIISNCYSSGTATGSGSNIDSFIGFNKVSAGLDSFSRSIAVEELNALISNGTLVSVTSNIVGANVKLQTGISSSQNSSIGLDFALSITELDSLLNNPTSAYSLAVIDSLLAKVSAKQVQFGATSNRLESALEEITVQRDNLISSRSTIRDADIAEVSSTYIQQQILQQASATLLATANQSPSIALQLI